MAVNPHALKTEQSITASSEQEINHIKPFNNSLNAPADLSVPSAKNQIRTSGEEPEPVTEKIYVQPNYLQPDQDTTRPQPKKAKLEPLGLTGTFVGTLGLTAPFFSLLALLAEDGFAGVILWIILFLLGLVVMLSTGILSLILGIASLQRIKASPGKFKGKGLAIASIAIGGLSIMAIVALFIPGLLGG